MVEYYQCVWVKTVSKTVDPSLHFLSGNPSVALPSRSFAVCKEDELISSRFLTSFFVIYIMNLEFCGFIAISGSFDAKNVATSTPGIAADWLKRKCCRKPMVGLSLQSCRMWRPSPCFSGHQVGPRYPFLYQQIIMTNASSPWFSIWW